MRVPRLSSAALASALAASVLVVVPAGVAQAAAPADDAPVASAAPATSCGNYGTMNAYVWASGVRVRTHPSLSATAIGECGPSWVHVDCQTPGDEVVDGSYRNNWWVFAESHVGNFYNGYISAVFIAGGSNDAPLPGIPTC